MNLNKYNNFFSQIEKNKIKKKMIKLSFFSTCQRKKVSCLILNENKKIISYAYNYNPIKFLNSKCEDNKNYTYSFVLHAEQTAINKLVKLNFFKKQKYIFLFTSCFPCYDCAVKIINTKFKYNIEIIIFYIEEYHNKISRFLFDHNNIKYHII